jgi:hypothetical protein
MTRSEGICHQVLAKKHESYPVFYNSAADSRHRVRFLRRDKWRRHYANKEKWEDGNPVALWGPSFTNLEKRSPLKTSEIGRYPKVVHHIKAKAPPAVQHPYRTSAHLLSINRKPAPEGLPKDCITSRLPPYQYPYLQSLGNSLTIWIMSDSKSGSKIKRSRFVI